MAEQKRYAGWDAISSLIQNIKDKYSVLGHKHTKSEITDFPTSLKNPNALTIQGNGTTLTNGTYDGSAAKTVNITPATIGAATATHDHDIADVANLQSNLDAKVPTSRTINNKALTGNITLSASDVGAATVANVNTAVGDHNTSTAAHNDIRDLITGLTNRLNALADSDDTTLDQMSEVVAYIKSNKDLIDEITTSKVNVADIINNLTTNVANKPLSAAQGVAIKALIDALDAELDTKAAASALTSHTDNTSNPHGVTAAQVGAVPTSRTVNGKALSANITLAAGDVGAYSTAEVDDKLATKAQVVFYHWEDGDI